MNKTILSGTVCTEPKVNHFTTNDGKDSAVARYKMAVNRPGARNSQNSDQQTADFPECVCFGGNALFVEKYVQKGTKLLVSGRIQTGSYTNKDGVKVYTTEVVVDSHEFIGSKPQNQQNQNQGYQYQQNAAPQTQGYQYQNQQMPNQQYASAPQTAPNQYGYRMPQNPVPTAPPQMTNEQFMQIPPDVNDGSLPFN